MRLATCTYSLYCCIASANRFFSGSSVLTQLLRSSDQAIKSSQISVLIRGAEKAKAFSDAGVNPILFNSLDESEVLEKVASEHDSKLIHAYLIK